ncbi:MAG: DUF2330 domain-containing protein [Myxococcota bacterium]|nr:DUF2330 domain-containing protein [Myxococcota bacterium]
MYILTMLTLVLGLPQKSFADPCGMVPPIAIQDQDKDDAIARTGIQRTYVMYKDGIETMVLHPEFRGKIDDFGMLIPFPSPPELRKVDDNIFANIEAAIAPPSVHLNHYKSLKPEVPPRAPQLKTRSASTKISGRLGAHDVRVREEAIGMYQVAVIEAGSAEALKKWMGDNQYRFPNGMESVAQEYVDERWCFVAIKTNIGQKPSITAQAGMRDVDTTLSEGASFDGYVQAMGFRFTSQSPVIPMRLSVFNGRDPQNVIYLLSDTPMQGDKLDEVFVDTYLSGTELYKNLTEPLEVVFKTDQVAKRTPEQQRQIDEKRNPDPYVKQARTLIGSDLLAIRNQALSLDIESKETALLAISESLMLRGTDINKLHTQSLATEQDRLSKRALSDVKDMTLTVFAGVLPNELIQNENLRFRSSTFIEKKSTRTDPLKPRNIVGTAYATRAFSFQGSPHSHTQLSYTPPKKRGFRIQYENFLVKNMDPQAARRAMQRYRNHFKYCYERALKDTPNVSGKIYLRMTADTDGKVREVVMSKSTVQNRSLETCILRRAKRFRFQRQSPQNNAIVQFELKLAP